MPALIAAHRFRAASAIAFRPAALSRRLWRTGVLVDRGWAPSDMVGRLALVVKVADVRPLPGGRPRRLPLIPPRASIARFNFSRSAISKARIWSVDIELILSTRIKDGRVRSTVPNFRNHILEPSCIEPENLNCVSVPHLHFQTAADRGELSSVLRRP